MLHIFVVEALAPKAAPLIFFLELGDQLVHQPAFVFAVKELIHEAGRSCASEKVEAFDYYRFQSGSRTGDSCAAACRFAPMIAAS